MRHCDLLSTKIPTKHANLIRGASCQIQDHANLRGPMAQSAQSGQFILALQRLSASEHGGRPPRHLTSTIDAAAAGTVEGMARVLCATADASRLLDALQDVGFEVETGACPIRTLGNLSAAGTGCDDAYRFFAREIHRAASRMILGISRTLGDKYIESACLCGRCF